MSYQRLVPNTIDDGDVFKAEHVQHIEDGIVANETNISAIDLGYTRKNTIARSFDEDEPFSAGEYAWYNNVLYRFTANHVGPWTDADADPVLLTEELGNAEGAVHYDAAQTLTVAEQAQAQANIRTESATNTRNRDRLIDYRGPIYQAEETQGSTSASCIGVNAVGETIEITGTNNTTGYVYIRLSGTGTRTSSSTTVQGWTGNLTIPAGRTIMTSLCLLSGNVTESDTGGVSISLYKSGSSSTVGTTTRIGKVHQRVWTSDGDAVTVTMLVAKGVTVMNAVYSLTIQDITEGDISHEQIDTLVSSNRLIPVDIWGGGAKDVTAGISIITNGNIVTISGTKTSGTSFYNYSWTNGIVKVSGDDVRNDSLLNKQVLLRAGHTYRITMRVVSGTYTPGSSYSADFRAYVQQVGGTLSYIRFTKDFSLAAGDEFVITRKYDVDSYWGFGMYLVTGTGVFDNLVLEYTVVEIPEEIKATEAFYAQNLVDFAQQPDERTATASGLTFVRKGNRVTVNGTCTAGSGQLARVRMGGTIAAVTGSPTTSQNAASSGAVCDASHVYRLVVKLVSGTITDGESGMFYLTPYKSGTTSVPAQVSRSYDLYQIREEITDVTGLVLWLSIYNGSVCTNAVFEATLEDVTFESASPSIVHTVQQGLREINKAQARLNAGAIASPSEYSVGNFISGVNRTVTSNQKKVTVMGNYVHMEGQTASGTSGSTYSLFSIAGQVAYKSGTKSDAYIKEFFTSGKCVTDVENYFMTPDNAPFVDFVFAYNKASTRDTPETFQFGFGIYTYNATTDVLTTGYYEEQSTVNCARSISIRLPPDFTTKARENNNFMVLLYGMNNAHHTNNTLDLCWSLVPRSVDKIPEVSGTTVNISAIRDTRYICVGTGSASAPVAISELTFTPSSKGICSVRFIAGSNMVLNLPQTVVMPDWWIGVEEGRTYEISIEDGVYGVVTSWA